MSRRYRTVFELEPPPTREELAARGWPTTREAYVEYLQRAHGPTAPLWAAWHMLSLAADRRVPEEEYSRLLQRLWEERRRRDAEICQRYRSGEPAGSLARAYGLSVRQIRRIVRQIRRIVRQAEQAEPEGGAR